MITPQADVVIYQAWAPLLIHFGDIAGALDSIHRCLVHVRRAIEEPNQSAELMGLGESDILPPRYYVGHLQPIHTNPPDAMAPIVFHL